MSGNKDSEDNLSKMHAHEFLQIRALCDEMISNICQAKALLEPISDDSFLKYFENETLPHYFYALNTIIECILVAKDEIGLLIKDLGKK